MELVHFQPIPGSDGHVTGYLHTPITEMAVRRESFPSGAVPRRRLHWLLAP